LERVDCQTKSFSEPDEHLPQRADGRLVFEICMEA